MCLEGLENFSYEHCITGQNPFLLEPLEELEVWAQARDLFSVKKNNKTHSLAGREFIIYETPPGNVMKFLNISEGRVSSTGLCWADFKALMSSIILEITNGNVNCSCVDFAKKHVCAHSLHGSVVLKKKGFPNGVMSIPIDQKPKRGRPLKALDWKADADPYKSQELDGGDTDDDVNIEPYHRLEIRCYCDNNGNIYAIYV